MTEDDKGFVLGQAGLYLRALGRLGEAAQPMQASLEAATAGKDWNNSARRAHNLSELYLTSGDLTQALTYARQGVELADRSGDAGERTKQRMKLANVLYQAGRTKEAEDAFTKGENMQREMQSAFPYLYSTRGFQYCDLLLGQEEYQEVQSRANQTIEIARRNNWLLDIGLDHLSLGRAYLLQGQQEGTSDFSQAATYLNQAVDGLRKAGHQEYLPLGLLARGELYRLMKDFEKAQHDLDEAMSIATRGGMRLHETVCYLENARLYLAMGEKAKARENLDKAKEMIKEMGYHRRDKEVKELEKQLKKK